MLPAITVGSKLLALISHWLLVPALVDAVVEEMELEDIEFGRGGVWVEGPPFDPGSLGEKVSSKPCRFILEARRSRSSCTLKSIGKINAKKTLSQSKSSGRMLLKYCKFWACEQDFQ